MSSTLPKTYWSTLSRTVHFVKDLSNECNRKQKLKMKTKMKVAIIKYNAGNIASVALALQRLGINPIITDDPETIKNSDKVIFPGVGEASTTMNYLRLKQTE